MPMTVKSKTASTIVNILVSAWSATFVLMTLSTFKNTDSFCSLGRILSTFYGSGSLICWFLTVLYLVTLVKHKRIVICLSAVRGTLILVNC